MFGVGVPGRIWHQGMCSTLRVVVARAVYFNARCVFYDLQLCSFNLPLIFGCFIVHFAFLQVGGWRCGWCRGALGTVYGHALKTTRREKRSSRRWVSPKQPPSPPLASHTTANG